MKIAHWVLGSVMLGLLGGCSVETASTAEGNAENAAEQAQPLFEAFNAFVVAQDTNGSFTPQPFGAFNSTRGTIKVTWLSTGRARVDFGSFGKAPGGNVQVGAYGDTNARCKVENWSTGTVTDALSIFVRCHSPSGVAVSVPFIASYQDMPQEGAHVWADQPTTASYTPNSRYSYNERSTNKVRRLSEGRYQVEMPSIKLPGGNAQVTAYGTDASYCNVIDWLRSSDTVTADIQCYDGNGAVNDSAFSFRFVTMDGGYSLDANYSWADQPTGHSYRPNTTYQDYASCVEPAGVLSCTTGTDNLADRYQQGHYSLDYPGAQGSPSTALVTAYGAAPNYCNVAEWYDFVGERVLVRCYDKNGNDVDTRFSQLYLAYQPGS